MEETLQARVHGDPGLPATLVYLPGMHGDWTLISGFRRAVVGKVRFIETTYPRTLTWSLDEYAAAVEGALADDGIESGWLLGESFGSQVLWAIIARKRFKAVGIILAGGFVKHPLRGAIRWAERLFGRRFLNLICRVIFGYSKIARFRFRKSPETAATLDEFLERRTPLDIQAAQYRLHLVAHNDPRQTAKSVAAPVFALAGILDPIVPWLPVKRWLVKNCNGLRGCKIIRADHNVLATAPLESARQILKWMNETDSH
ncbi:MAG: alpha/beta hydrolase [Verrucomicrobiota bacterium]|nr:alpha/beta hydrolase [Verrucomicrobiota bacterium]